LWDSKSETAIQAHYSSRSLYDSWRQQGQNSASLHDRLRVFGPRSNKKDCVHALATHLGLAVQTPNHVGLAKI